MLKAVVFDFDGVLADTEPLHRQATAAVFSEIGLSAPLSTEGSGMTESAFFRQLAAAHSLPHAPEQLADRKHEHLMRLAVEAKEMPGAADVLRALAGRGLSLAISSNSRRQFVGAVLQRLGLAGRFSVIVTAEDLRYGKPLPEAYLVPCQRLQLPPAECLAVEDSTKGVLAAKAAGLRCIGFQRAGEGSQDFAMADAVIHDLREIDAFLLKVLR